MRTAEEVIAASLAPSVFENNMTSVPANSLDASNGTAMAAWASMFFEGHAGEYRGLCRPVNAFHKVR
jgi:hypothetical protein